MKAILSLTAFVIVLGVLCSGCGTASTPVSFDNLVTGPEQYSGRTVTVEGIYVNSWERTVLVESIGFTGSGESRRMTLSGDPIWFSGFLPNDAREKLFQHYSKAEEAINYGKVRVTGLFETEGKYGHMNLYKYRITASDVEIIDWTPPE